MATQYSDTFKQDTLRYIQDNPQKSRKDIAAELGISYGTSKDWCARARESDVVFQQMSNPPTLKELEQENRRLKRELEMAHKDNEILKKFGVYMAKLQK
jgi:transposase-like protein